MKLDALMDFLKKFESAVIAFSGGVDSSTLAGLCREAGLRVLAITVRSEVTPRREVEDAIRAAEEVGVEHTFLDLQILDENFARNSEERCYFCKKKILGELVKIARRDGYDAVFEGTNFSDLSGHRPGYKAVREFEIVYSPWVEFGFTKEEIREIARLKGYSFHGKPSLACLASRIPFGIIIDERKLKMVDFAEEEVIKLAGVRQVRVRNYDGVAVIQVEKSEIVNILSVAERIRDALKDLGFRAVLLDLDGYESGKKLF